MHIEATKTFIRLYKKMPEDLKERVKKALVLLESNPSHPSLGHKKMAGQENIFEIRVSENYRITYQRIQDIAYLRKIGTHDLLRNP
ncbi:MAG: type II toxin-antitoxin system RelE/ParE family toxin [Candidatus Omnitrophica bacterium]|nr:type II toxin-antitoxin system RelE/ParE family toxin [Candidatus Omnitrophota bacterium]